LVHHRNFRAQIDVERLRNLGLISKVSYFRRETFLLLSLSFVEIGEGRVERQAMLKEIFAGLRVNLRAQIEAERLRNLKRGKSK